MSATHVADVSPVLQLVDAHRTEPVRRPLGRPTLLVASTGGHLKQLHRLRGRLGDLGEHVVWLTFDTPQSRSLLAGEQVAFIRFTGPRDYRGVAANALPMLRFLRSAPFGAVVSTGSAIALDCLPAAVALGIKAYYVESAARSAGPSLTGQFLQRVPGVRTFTQYRAWADRRWRFAGSVFDGFAAREGEPATLDGARVVVTLGTLRFPFPRMVDRLHDLLPPTADVLWQTGSTDVRHLGIEGHVALPAATLRAEMRAADLVVAHAGVGAALESLEAGQCPILIPRSHAQDEHVDDHQAQIATELSGRGLAISRTPGDLTLADLEAAAGRSCLERAVVPALRFADSTRTKRPQLARRALAWVPPAPAIERLPVEH